MADRRITMDADIEKHDIVLEYLNPVYSIDDAPQDEEDIEAFGIRRSTELTSPGPSTSRGQMHDMLSEPDIMIYERSTPNRQRSQIAGRRRTTEQELGHGYQNPMYSIDALQDDDDTEFIDSTERTALTGSGRTTSGGQQQNKDSRIEEVRYQKSDAVRALGTQSYFLLQAPETEPKKRNWKKICLISCLALVLASLVIVAIAVPVAMKNRNAGQAVVSSKSLPTRRPNVTDAPSGAGVTGDATSQGPRRTTTDGLTTTRTTVVMATTTRVPSTPVVRQSTVEPTTPTAKHSTAEKTERTTERRIFTTIAVKTTTATATATCDLDNMRVAFDVKRTETKAVIECDSEMTVQYVIKMFQDCRARTRIVRTDEIGDAASPYVALTFAGEYTTGFKTFVSDAFIHCRILQ